MTVEMYASFFREVLLPDVGLFEAVGDDVTSSIGLLPSPSAPPESLTAGMHKVWRGVVGSAQTDLSMAPMLAV